MTTRRHQMPATLSPERRERLFPDAHLRSDFSYRHTRDAARAVESGMILIEQGDNTMRFFVVLSGEVEIVQPGCEDEKEITVHSARPLRGRCIPAVRASKHRYGTHGRAGRGHRGEQGKSNGVDPNRRRDWRHPDARLHPATR